MGAIYVGDTGTEIYLDCGMDIREATVHEMSVRKPDGTTVIWPAVVSGQNSLKHVAVDGDLSAPGAYLLQARITLPWWSGLGATAVLDVSEPFMS